MLAALLALLLAVSPLLSLNSGFAEEGSEGDGSAAVSEEAVQLLADATIESEVVYETAIDEEQPASAPVADEPIAHEPPADVPVADEPIATEPPADEPVAEIEAASDEMFMPKAAGDPIDVVLRADNGDINFDGIADSATMGLASEGAKGYNMKVTAFFPSLATGKSITISLAEGLTFVSDGSEGATLGGFLSSAVVNKVNTAPFGISTSMVNTGSKTYNFIDGAESLTIDLIVSADTRYWLDGAITDAITVSVDYDGSKKHEVKLESLTIDNSNKNYSVKSTYAGYADTDTQITASGGINSMFWMASNLVYSHFIKSCTVVLKVTDPNCIVSNSNPSDWLLDSSDSANGNYIFSYVGAGNGSMLSGNPGVPVRYEFPSQDFLSGDVVSSTFVYSTELFGGKTLEASGKHTFTILGDHEDGVFVNFASLSSAVNSGLNTTDTVANTGSTSSLLSGAIGFYVVGNKSTQDALDQVVELTFDDNNLGVMGLDVPIPYGQTITEIEYKTTVNSSTWQTAIVSLNSLSTTQSYGYVSREALGVAGDAYLIGIRYTLDAIPAASVLGITSSSISRCGIYGITLETGSVATSTVSVYPAGSPNEAVSGKIYSDHRSGYASFNLSTAKISSASRSVSAGNIISFSYRIAAMQASAVNNVVRNSAVEHPVIYLRSEGGNEITNIKIVNNREVDITDYLIISPSFNNGIWTYEVDTTDVPEDLAAVAFRMVGADGSKGESSLVLSYDIVTKPTDEGTFKYADMLFVEAPLTEYYHNSPTTYATTDDPHGLSSGGRVFGLPTANIGTYTITPRTDVVVSLAAKHYRADEYGTWAEGKDSIALGLGVNSAMDLKLDVLNNSGTDVTNDTIIYLPIPKENDNWGDLLHDGAPLEFSMVLKEAISMPAGITGTIEYASVVPTDNGSLLNAYAFESFSVGNADSYNCIKIKITYLPDSNVPARFLLKMGAEASTNEDGLVDTWRTAYYQNLTNSAGDSFSGWFEGGYMSTVTALGEIQGNIWLDSNTDGIKDAGETSLTVNKADGWTVSVYAIGAAGTGIPIQTVEIGVDDDGSVVPNYYHITDLLNEHEYDLAVTNPDNTTYIFTRVSTDATGNKAAGVSANDHASAVIPAAKTEILAFSSDPAFYNIGLMPATKTTTLTWESQDTTKGSVVVTGGDAGTNVSSGAPFASIAANVVATANTGYTFDGWATSASGTVNASLPPFGAGGLYGYDDIEYYAVFSANEVAVSYDLNASSLGTSTPAFTPATGSETAVFGKLVGSTTATPASNVDPGVPEAWGYAFTGWYASKADADAQANPWVFSSTIVQVEPLTLYAGWTPSKVSISFDPKGGTIASPGTVLADYDSSVTSAATVARDGYIFAGWKASGKTGTWVFGGSGSALTAENGVVEASGSYSLTLEAQWQAASVNIEYRTGYGTNDAWTGFTNGTAASTASFDGAITEAPNVNPAREGYIFAGWKVSEKPDNWTFGASGTALRLANGVEKNDSVDPATYSLTLEAQWDACKVTILYAMNDGSGAFFTDFTNELGAQDRSYDSTVVQVPDSNPVRDGYTFAGWYLTGNTNWKFGPQGTGDILNLANGLVKDTSGVVATYALTLQARWSSDPVEVTYLMGDGTLNTFDGFSDPAAKTGDYDGFLVKPDVNPVYTGHTFLGWKQVDKTIDWIFAGETNETALSIDNGVVKDDTSTPPVYSLTLEAQWSIDSYDLNFDLNGADSNPASYKDMKVVYGSRIKQKAGFPANPTRAGHVFRGWEVSPGTWLLNNTLMPANDITLTAQWEKGIIIGAGDIIIVASPFTMSLAEAVAHQNKNVSEKMDELIERGNASAWNADTLKSVNISRIYVMPAAPSGEGIAAVAGDYRVTYTAKEGNSSVSCVVSAKVFDNAGASGRIAGNNFKYNVSGGALSEGRIRSLASVTVFDKEGQATNEQARINAADLDRLNSEIAALGYSATKDVWVKFTDATGNEVFIKVTIQRGAAPVIPVPDPTPVDPKPTPKPTPTPTPTPVSPVPTIPELAYQTIILEVEETQETKAEEKAERKTTTPTSPQTKKQESDVKAAEISEDGIPLGAFNSKEHTSITNLLFALIGVVVAVAHLVLGLRRKEGAQVSASYKNGGQNKTVQVGMSISRIVVVVLGVAAAVALLVLENYSLSFAWINQWTIVFIAILALQLAFSVAHALMSKQAKKAVSEESRAPMA